MSEQRLAIAASLKPGIETSYPVFSVDNSEATEFATNPEGAIHLDPDGANVSIVLDAKPRNFVGGSAIDTSTRLGRWANRLVNGSDDTVIHVGIRTATRVKPPHEIEGVIAHELTHVRQIRDKDPKIRIGQAVMGATMLVGATAGPVVEAVAQKDFQPLITIYTSLAGLAVGHKVGYCLAPHEREARKIQRETPYQGIVTGTRNPDFESRHEKVLRKQQESNSRAKSLFWGALSKITARS